MTPITAAGCHLLNKDGVFNIYTESEGDKTHEVHLSLQISPSAYSGQRESQAKKLKLPLKASQTPSEMLGGKQRNDSKNTKRAF